MSNTAFCIKEVVGTDFTTWYEICVSQAVFICRLSNIARSSETSLKYSATGATLPTPTSQANNYIMIILILVLKMFLTVQDLNVTLKTLNSLYSLYFMTNILRLTTSPFRFWCLPVFWS